MFLLYLSFLHRQFGKAGKGKSADHTPVVDVRKTRDLERALEKAKNENLQLHLQLQKAREEVTALRTECKSHTSNTMSPVIKIINHNLIRNSYPIQLSLIVHFLTKPNETSLFCNTIFYYQNT